MIVVLKVVVLTAVLIVVLTVVVIVIVVIVIVVVVVVVLIVVVAVSSSSSGRFSFLAYKSMSHSVVCKDSDLFYCSKCGAKNDDLQSERCKAAIHEEKLEVKKLNTQRFFYSLAILVQLGIFVLIFKGFDSIAQAVNKIMGDIQTVLYECSRGGWVRLIKSFLNQN